ncbi:BppU family phage baseplate upper protein [Enterococcus faecium]|uniref:BppU family phage baseplate upper protein n=1 Tax=Enterococcus faecium TaxID=1352 RepID=UPI001573B212|nr:BppU family phage baseplate upper protein [Enterococcus faecium]MBD9760441.1 BppU family phage baseplate upper protein [Enterococcus faecium]MBD9782533.1 BppU family phage baseplate upper protein [Enterococcus faecium]NTM12636.1 BppU family phage baseplate upper protein [Enterococcus faecium]
MVYKMNESIIVIQAEATSPNRTNVVFWSHDRGTAKLKFKLMKNNLPLPIPDGTTVPIRLIFKSATAEGGYGKHDYLATIEDRVNGIVSIVLEDNILGYVGKVEGSVYIDFPNDRSLDTAGRFTFDIKRSPIDDSTPELEDYYFNGFSQTIDKIEKILADGKQEIEQKIAESETQIEAKLKDTNDKITKANQDVATLNTNIDKVNDRIDQTNEQIGDLGMLKKMYSNSIDFGGYDYSGNPNLMRKLSFEDWDLMGEGITKADANGEYVSFDFSGEVTDMNMYAGFSHKLPLLKANQKYTLTAEVSTDVSWEGRIRMSYRINKPDGSPAPSAVGTLIGDVTNPQAGVWYELTTMENNHTIPDLVNNYKSVWLQINLSNRSFKGKLNVRYNIKIEEGETSTPYQPNLLDAPYYLSKKTLGKNLLDPTGITSSSYLLLTKTPSEKLLKDQTYTITLKGTKPATQTFRCFVQYETDGSTVNLLDMKPVEGLVDEWQLTFKATRSASDITGRLYVYQVPNTSLGQCKVEWIKLEKGDTRTPNISEYKYFGEGLKDSNNPNDYSWDVTPEYTEKGLNDSVSLTKPQSVDGTKNFLETPLVNGKNVLVEEKPLPYEAWHSTGTEQTGISNKARLIIGPVATTIGAKLNRSMKENPLTWNSGNWQATANRDCTLLVEGLVRYQFGGSTAGQYGYITFYKDDAQNSSIGFAGGVGINGTALQWKHGLHFSRIFALKKGEYFNITFETQDGKKLDFSQINTLHIMEIES